MHIRYEPAPRAQVDSGWDRRGCHMMKRFNVLERSEVVSARSRPADKVSPSGRLRITPPWWFALPALAVFAFVVLVPSVRGLYYAFTNWDGLDPSFSFVGLANFSELLKDPDAKLVVWH